MAEPNFLQRIISYANPFSREEDVTKNLNRYIAPVQLQRIRQDMLSWRECITEAENAWYPHRVKMQRMFVDTILSGHTLACVQKRKDMTLLRDWHFKNESGLKNDKQKELLEKKWFAAFLEYALEARFYGYSLIKLDDLVNGEFPKLNIIRRWNVSPDRLVVSSLVYSLSGAPFLEEPYADWHIWVSTPSDTGVSDCGYGLLYNVAQYEILARNLLGQNADAVELYGQPVRVGKTSKSNGPERDTFEQALQAMGSSAYILMDAIDEIELLESKGTGQGYKIYPDLEQRLEKKISKLILGHADAIDSVPGKLGNDGEESPASQALEDKQMSDGAFLEDVVNTILIPKLINLGFSIDATYKFCFGNNHELVEQRKNEDANNQMTATIAYTMSQAGLKMDAKYFEERTGIKTTEVVEPKALPTPKDTNFSNRVKNKLEETYGK